MDGADLSEVASGGEPVGQSVATATTPTEVQAGCGDGGPPGGGGGMSGGGAGVVSQDQSTQSSTTNADSTFTMSLAAVWDELGVEQSPELAPELSGITTLSDFTTVARTCADNWVALFKDVPADSKVVPPPPTSHALAPACL
jgi:hypothetical protein